MQLPKVYDPSGIESRWYEEWLDRGYFHAVIDESAAKFSMVIPPPNITGSLHMGHALNNTIQDIVTRRRRMQGRVALWLPGTDHAGIATQNVVERELAKDGMTKHDIGREAFIERVWEWREQYGGTIITQLKRLGCSCDWTRERFTMDDGCSRAVRAVFVALYRDGLIYRDKYIINWCPRCHTALSDIEVEHRETDGALYHIRYPITDGRGHITVATTRPETMLADTAVAVNPNDPRYASLIGSIALLPLLGRELPIIADDYVDPEFGTGALKVTPGHDLNDFEIGRRHGLTVINMFNEDATVNEHGGPYEGLSREDARRRVVEDLKREHLLEKEEPYRHSIGHCYRCDTVVEPYLSNQWFVRMKPLADPAIAAARDSSIRFIPEKFAQVYYDWMENIRDWCISRQLWWGHRIPVWYCDDCAEILVEEHDPSECPSCGSRGLRQDDDVLDTWFSSALWPFSTLGWPEETEDLRYFYPTDLLVTAHDIIFFWVARMIMMGIRFRGDVPFRDVYIHTLIRDAEGQKMSKSRGNVLDPLDIIDEYGADALRFSLASMAVPGRDILFSLEKVVGYRTFCNKIWNAARFVLMNYDEEPPPLDVNDDRLTLADRWILTRYSQTVEAFDREMEAFELAKATALLYNFFWDDYCDYYIELAKPSLAAEGDERARTLTVLVFVLEGFLTLLHPIMPFITEEIHARLGGKESLVVTAYPTVGVRSDDESTTAMEALKDVVRAVRSTLADLNVQRRQDVDVLVRADGDAGAMLAENSEYLVTLTQVRSVQVGADIERPQKSAVAVTSGAEVFIPLGGLVDLEAERARLAKRLTDLGDDKARTERKLTNPGFIEKADEAIVDKERAKLHDFIDEEARITRLLESLS